MRPWQAPSPSHASLADKSSSNSRFRSAVADIISPPNPEQKEMPLEYYILCGWLTSCLWLLDNDDRAILLNRVIWGNTCCGLTAFARRSNNLR